MDDVNKNITVCVEIDDEGNGETTFAIPQTWESEHKVGKEGIPRMFYLKCKETEEEFPRAYFIKNVNQGTEEKKQKNDYELDIGIFSGDYVVHKRINALMLKVATSVELSEATEKNNAVILGEEYKLEEEVKNCICHDYNLIWGSKVSCDFRKKVVEVAASLWGESNKIKMANELMACMAFETGQKFKSDTGYPSATGLIQFTSGKYGAITAMNETGYNNKKNLTKEFLKDLSPLAQLDYVQLYFEMWLKHYKKTINDALDMYMTIWCPSATGKPDEYVCYNKRRNEDFYNSNKSAENEYYDESEKEAVNRLKKYVNSKNNGEITKGELRARLKFWTELGKTTKHFKSECTELAPTSVIKEETPGYWNIYVSGYKDRAIHGKGIATLVDDKGSEVFRFNVLLMGAKGRDRLKIGNDTPTGVYNIPESYVWIAGSKSGEKRHRYGPNHRLVMVGESGQIITSGRNLIRIHGGRQEDSAFNPKANLKLKKTNGCIRAFDADMITLKRHTDVLTNDKSLKAGKVFVIDDLIEKNGNYVLPEN